MHDNKILNYIKDVIKNMPSDWFDLTTHRLDIYNEKLAKTEFLNRFEALFNTNNSKPEALAALPTAYDYIRLGHPLSCILEWVIANLNNLNPKDVISFSSKTIPIFAILRKNLIDNKHTQILYTGELPECFDAEMLRSIYGYQFDLKRISPEDNISDFNGSTIFVSHQDEMNSIQLHPNVDFFIGIHSHLGSILLVNDERNKDYVSEIQHVRRRETIAMTPANSLDALKLLIDKSSVHTIKSDVEGNKTKVFNSIKAITRTDSMPLTASSGLSMQYAIMMGLIHYAVDKYPDKEIRFVVPPNCYGGTNDQARRVAACLDKVQVLDLPVDGDHDMVQSIDLVLDQIAKEDAIPYVIAEIPTNPRVEVPDLIKLKEALSTTRNTASGEIAVDPVFILDQTFCPNKHFLGEGEILSTVRAISYVSGSKFPSGGQCTAGYCVGNTNTKSLLNYIEKHLTLCDNKARNLQMGILATQLPSMNQRIKDAYANTRDFVNFIQDTLPEAKINFVSEELAKQGFTPSVFSLDLPTKGNTDEERELYKRELNHKLIKMMITQIPNESKYCVSYGQLKGCYWTIPATSTQGTTKEGDKDYIARVSLSPNLDLELHKKVFKAFVDSI
ncbi:MAG: cystathionine beta-synthase [Bacteroidia bacterium]|nr:cystathionine beta-synthase [Bacteroidia bacterium]